MRQIGQGKDHSWVRVSFESDGIMLNLRCAVGKEDVLKVEAEVRAVVDKYKKDISIGPMMTPLGLDEPLGIVG